MSDAARSRSFGGAYAAPAELGPQRVALAMYHALRASYVLRDCAFLSLLIPLSLVLYVHRLGFYIDDWQYLGRLSVAADKSFVGLMQAAWDQSFSMRPAQLVYTVVMCSLFGLAPLGYHLVNALLLTGMAIFFYLALNELGQQRVLSVSLPLVYLLLPHYSTDRFWFMADGANLSIGLYLLSLFADLRSVAYSSWPSIRWKLVSVVALLLSTLTYEHALLLFLLNPLLAWYRAGAPRGRVRLAVLLAPNVVLVALVGLFKVVTTTRLAQHPFSADQGAWFIGTAESEVYYHLATLGLYLPASAWRLFSAAPDPALAVLAVVTLMLTAIYVSKLGQQLPSRRSLGALLAAGGFVYVLACATFFVSHGDLQATPTGPGNRTAIAAAGGVALILVGASGFASSLIPVRRLRMGAFSMLIALVCTAGVVIINSLAAFWVAAAEQQQAVLDDIGERFATLPAGTALVLDGVCPYIGPAVVFEGGTWDLTGALYTMYGDPTIKGDLVTPRLSVTEDGFLMEMYGFTQQHAYPSVLLYNVPQQRTYRFADAEAARAYFARFNPDLTGSCPTAVPGFGVPVI